jgi:hypothetical protein
MATGAITALIQTQSSIEQGLPVAITQTFTGTTRVTPNVTCPVAIQGELTTRTNDTDGIVTAAAHGIAGPVGTTPAVDFIGLYWVDPTDGVTDKFAYGCTITAADTNTITFEATGGDVLPAATAGTTAGTTVYICVGQRVTNITLPADTGTEMFQITTTLDNGYCVLMSAGSVVELATFVTLDVPYIWPLIAGADSPLDASITVMDFYGTDTASTLEVKLDAVLE